MNVKTFIFDVLTYICPPPPAKYTDYKTSWPPEPIGHKSWKASRSSSQSQMSRPPPGLVGQKQPSSSPWSGGAPRLAGRGWGSGAVTAGMAPTFSSLRPEPGLGLKTKRLRCGFVLQPPPGVTAAFGTAAGWCSATSRRRYKPAHPTSVEATGSPFQNKAYSSAFSKKSCQDLEKRFCSFEAEAG